MSRRPRGDSGVRAGEMIAMRLSASTDGKLITVKHFHASVDATGGDDKA